MRQGGTPKGQGEQRELEEQSKHPRNSEMSDLWKRRHLHDMPVAKPDLRKELVPM